MRLLLYPDSGLACPAAPVRLFGAELAPVVEGVSAVMGQAGAVGLTAPHCGVPLRLVVVRHPGAARLVYANPVLRWTSDETAEHEEGSVSMPGVRAAVSRPARVRVAFQDEEGREREAALDGFDAAILQHEMDQLDGIFWLERLSRLKRERLVKRYVKLRGRP